MSEITDIKWKKAECLKCQGDVTVYIQFKNDAVSHVSVEPCPACLETAGKEAVIAAAYSAVRHVVGILRVLSGCDQSTGDPWTPEAAWFIREEEPYDPT